MIKRRGEYPRELREGYRGAPGRVEVEHIMAPEEYFGKGRLFAKCTLAPGSGVGYHEHHNEMELFYILEGQAELRCGDAVEVLGPGDSIITGDGEGHSLMAVGDTNLSYLAVILFKEDPA